MLNSIVMLLSSPSVRVLVFVISMIFIVVSPIVIVYLAVKDTINLCRELEELKEFETY